MGDLSGLDNAEVADLFRRYGFFLRRRARMITRDPSCADDALQEAWVKVMKNGAAVRDVEKPLLWLYRVVDRCCLDQLRRGKRLRAAAPLDSVPPADLPQHHDGVEERDLALMLLQDLDDTDQRIVVLAFVDGLSQGEIASEIGLSRVTVNKRVQAIRERATSKRRAQNEEAS